MTSNFFDDFTLPLDPPIFIWAVQYTQSTFLKHKRIYLYDRELFKRLRLLKNMNKYPSKKRLKSITSGRSFGKPTKMWFKDLNPTLNVVFIFKIWHHQFSWTILNSPYSLHTQPRQHQERRVEVQIEKPYGILSKRMGHLNPVKKSPLQLLFFMFQEYR